jgi:hypothetical protein
MSEKKQPEKDHPENKLKVVCYHCGKEVEVKMIVFGYGRIAICPICRHLAYNGD